MATLLKQPAEWVEKAPVQIVATKTIDAAPSAVWAAIADHEGWPSWFDSIDSVEVTGEATGVGGKRRVLIGRRVKVDEEFTEWVPNEVFAFTVTQSTIGGLRSMNERVRLTANGAGTTVEYRMALDPKLPLKPVLMVAKGKIEAGLGDALDALADKVTSA